MRVEAVVCLVGRQHLQELQLQDALRHVMRDVITTTERNIICRRKQDHSWKPYLNVAGALLPLAVIGKSIQISHSFCQDHIQNAQIIFNRRFLSKFEFLFYQYCNKFLYTLFHTFYPYFFQFIRIFISHLLPIKKNKIWIKKNTLFFGSSGQTAERAL